jgi:hypothetical protein
MKSHYLAPLFSLGILSAVVSHAQVLMLDFGPTTTTTPTNSPYHSVVPTAGSTWNTVSSNSVAAGGLSYSNGSTATGVTLNLGTATGTSNTAPATTLNVVSPSTSFSGLGSTVNTGIYANNSVGTDGVFISGGNANTFASVGLQIGGLAAGTYDIYVTSQNTNSSLAYRQNVYTGTSATSGNFTYAASSTGTGGSAVGAAASGYSLATVAYNGTNSTSAWVEATSGNLVGNYTKISVTLSSGEFLNLAVTGQFNEDRGFLNSVQIVNTSPIPEPSTYAVLTGAVMLGVACLLRRRL